MSVSATPLRLRHLLLSTSALTGFVLASAAQAGQVGLPTGGVVAVGSATIAQSSATQLTVTTGTNRTVIDWQGFSIAAGNKVAIQQPGASSITVNEVTGQDPSKIFGDLSSNGRVVLANPNGIWFGPNSHVDVAGLVASTATLSADAKKAFAAGGRLSLDVAGKSTASVVNDGHISIADEGLAALVAPGVRNNGVIEATLGSVTLASGETSTLDFYGDGLVSLAVTSPVQALAIGPDGKPFQATIENKGKIAAQHVLVTADVVKGVVDSSINMSGVIEAKGVTVSGGDIILDGGDGAVSLAGSLDVTSQQAKGGTVEVTGGAVTIAATARIDVSGAKGGGTVAIGGGPHGGGTLRHAKTVLVQGGSAILANATVQGTGGTVSIWSDQSTAFDGAIQAKGAGTGSGGWVETSSEGILTVGLGATVDTLAPHGPAGTWLLDPASIIVATGGGATLTQAADTTDTASSITIDPTVIDGASSNVVLSATTSIAVNNAISMTNAGVGITFEGTTGQITTGPTAGTTLGASITTNGGAVQIFGALTVANNVTISTGSAAITLNKIDDAATNTDALTLNAGTGAVTFNDSIGATKNLQALSVTGATITLGTATVNATNQTFAGAVTLSQSVTLTASGIVHLAGTIDGTTPGNEALTILDTSGSVELDGAVGGTTALNALAVTANALTLAGGGITVSQLMNITAPVTLGADTTITLTGASSDTVKFAGPIDGAHALGISFGGNSPTNTIEFDQTLGGNTPLASVSLNAGNFGVITLGGTASASVFTTGDQSWTADIQIGQDTVIRSQGGNLTFSQVGFDGFNGTHRLVLSAYGTIDLSTALFNGTVGDVIVVGGAVNAAAGTSNNGSYTQISGTMPQSLSGNVDYDTIRPGGAITLAGDTVITATGENMDLTGFINGTQMLTLVDSSFHIAIDASLGGATQLSGLDVTATGISLGANISANGNIGFHGPVVLTVNPSITSSNGNIDFGSTIDDSVAGTSTLTIIAGGTIGFSGIIGGSTPLNNLEATATGGVDVGVNIDVVNQMNFYSPVMLTGTAALTAGSVTFNSSVDGNQTLAINVGNTVKFAHAVGSETPLGRLEVFASSVLLGTGSTGASITAESELTLSAIHATFYGDTVLRSQLGDLSLTNVGFVGGTTGTNLVLSASGNLNVSGVVSSGSVFGNVLLVADTLTGFPTLFQSGTLQQIITMGSAQTVSGVLNYDSIRPGGAITLGGNTTITSTNENMDFTGTIDGTTAGSQMLTLTGTSNIAIDAAIGGTTALSSLSLSSATAQVNAPITTNSTLGITLQATTGALATGVAGSLTATGNGSVSVTGRTGVTIGAPINAGGGIAIYGNRYAVASGTYNNDVAINASLTDTNGTFRLMSPYAIYVTTHAGSIVTNASSVLSSPRGIGVGIRDTGSLDLNGMISTTGSTGLGIALFANGVTLASGATLSTGASSISIVAINGDMQFDGVINATTVGNVEILTSNGTATQASNASITAATLLLAGSSGGSLSNSNGVFQLTGTANNIGTLAAYTQSVTLNNGGHSMAIDTVPSLIEDSGTRTGIDISGDLMLTNISVIRLNANINAAGMSGVDLTGVSNLAVGQSITISAPNGSIDLPQIYSSVTTANSLVITSGGTVGFHGAVGVDASYGQHQIGTLAVTATTGITLFSDVSTYHGQSFNGPVTIAGNIALQAQDTGISFSSTVDGATGTEQLQIFSSSYGAQNFYFGGAVAGTHGLGSISITAFGPDTVNFTSPVGGGTAGLGTLMVNAGTIILGGNVTTVSDQGFNGAVTLTNDVNLVSGTGNITFNSTIDSDSTARSIMIMADTVEIDDTVGGTSPVQNFTINANSFVGSNAGPPPFIFANGTISYPGYTGVQSPPPLMSDYSGTTDLTGTYTYSGNFTITVTGGNFTLDSGAKIDGTGTLTIVDAGYTLTINGAIGSIAQPAAVTLRASNIAIAGSAATTGAFSALVASGGSFTLNTGGTINTSGPVLVAPDVTMDATGDQTADNNGYFHAGLQVSIIGDITSADGVYLKASDQNVPPGATPANFGTITVNGTITNTETAGDGMTGAITGVTSPGYSFPTADLVLYAGQGGTLNLATGMQLASPNGGNIALIADTLIVADPIAKIVTFASGTPTTPSGAVLVTPASTFGSLYGGRDLRDFSQGAFTAPETGAQLLGTTFSGVESAIAVTTGTGTTASTSGYLFTIPQGVITALSGNTPTNPGSAVVGELAIGLQGMQTATTIGDGGGTINLPTNSFVIGYTLAVNGPINAAKDLSLNSTQQFNSDAPSPGIRINAAINAGSLSVYGYRYSNIYIAAPITTTGTLAVSTQGAIVQTAALMAGGELDLIGSNGVQIGALVHSDTSVYVYSRGGDGGGGYVNVGAVVTSPGNIYMKAKYGPVSITNSGSITAGGTLTVTGVQGVVIDGTVAATGPVLVTSGNYNKSGTGIRVMSDSTVTSSNSYVFIGATAGTSANITTVEIAGVVAGKGVTLASGNALADSTQNPGGAGIYIDATARITNTETAAMNINPTSADLTIFVMPGNPLHIDAGAQIVATSGNIGLIADSLILGTGTATISTPDTVIFAAASTQGTFTAPGLVGGLPSSSPVTFTVGSASDTVSPAIIDFLSGNSSSGSLHNAGTVGALQIGLQGATNDLQISNPGLFPINTTFYGDTIQTTGQITGNGSLTFDAPNAIRLVSDTSVTSNGGGTIDFGSQIRLLDGSAALTLATTGTVIFETTVGAANGPIGALAVYANHIEIDGDIYTNGGQTFFSGTTEIGSATTSVAGSVTVTSGSQLLTDTSGDISFDGTIGGPMGGTGQLTVTAQAGSIHFMDAVTNLSTLTATATGPLYLLGPVTTSGNQTYNGATELDGTYTTTDGMIKFNGDATLVGDSTVSVSASTTQSNITAVTFTGRIDGAHALTITAPNDELVLGGAVGSLDPLAALSVTGLTTLGGGVTSVGGQTYGGQVQLGSATTFTSTDGGTIDFAGLLDSPVAMTVITAGTVKFEADVGANGSPIGALAAYANAITIGGNVYTSGGQTYGGTTQINGNTTSVAGSVTVTGATPLLTDTSGNIYFAGTVAGQTGTEQLSVTAQTGSIYFIGNVTNLAALTATAAGPIQLPGAITTSGNQTYNGTTDLDGTYTATNGTITINGDATLVGDSMVSVSTSQIGATAVTVTGLIDGGYALAISAPHDNVVLDGAIGSQTPLTAFTLAAGLLNSASVYGGTPAITLLNGATPSITLTGVQVELSGALNNGTYNFTSDLLLDGTITLGANTVITVSGGDIQITGTIDGAYSLTLKDLTTNTITILGAIGSGTKLTSLTLTSNGTIALGGAISTVGNQAFNAPVTLTNTVALTSSGTVSFANTVDGAQALTISDPTGSVVFGGNVGSGSALSSLAITAAAIALPGNVTTSGTQAYSGDVTASALDLETSGGAILFGGNVTTDSGQAYHGSVTLTGANTTLTDTGATSQIHFYDTVGGQDLVVDATGSVVFDAAASLASLAVTAGSITLPTSVTTLGDQSFAGAMHLVGDTTLGAGGTITLTGTLDGATDGGQSLTIANAGNLRLGGIIGGVTELNQFVDGAATVLTGATEIHTAGSILVTGSVNGGYALALDDGAQTQAVVELTGGVGTITPLASLAISANDAIIIGGAINTIGDQSYNIGVTLVADTSFSSGGALDFGGSIGGAYALAISATGAVEFSGPIDVGSFALSAGSLTNGFPSVTTTSGSFAIAVGEGTMTLDGNYSFSDFTDNGVIVLMGDSQITTTGTLSLGGTIDGAHSLTLDAGSTASVTGIIGGATALTGLTVIGPGGIMLGGTVTTTGAQNYQNAVTLVGTALLQTAGAVTFGSTIDGGFGLTIDAGSVHIGTAGGTVALASLTIDAATASLGSVTTTGAQSYTGSTVLDGNFTGSSFSATGADTLAGATSITATSGNVAFGSTIDGAQNLTLAATNGSITVAGAVGSQAALSSLTLGGGGDAVTFTGSVTAAELNDTRSSGSLTVAGGLAVATYVASASNDVLISISGGVGPLSLAGEFDFATALDLSSRALTLTGATVLDTSGALTLGSVDGAYALTLNAGSAAVAFKGAVGATTALGGLTITGGTISLGNVHTTGAQVYNGAVTMGGTYIASSFTANGTDLLAGATGVTVTGGNIGFGSLSGTQALTLVDTTGIVSLGNVTGLANLTITASGIVGGSVISTVGSQTYSGPLTLASTSALTSTAGDLTFGGTINGTKSLTLSAGGNITFGGTLAASTNRTVLSILTANNVTVINNSSLWVDRFTATANSLEFGDHSLESDDVVTINASSVDGRVISSSATLNVNTATGIIQGDTVTIAATGAVSEQMTGGAILVRSASFDGAATATRSVDINSTGDVSGNIAVSGGTATITGATVSGSVTSSGLAMITASEDVTANVLGGSVTINAGDSVTGSVTSTGGPIVIVAGNAVNSTIVAENGGSISVTAGNSIRGSATGGAVTLTAPLINETVNAQTAVINSADATINGTISGTDADIALNGGASNITQAILGATQQVASNADSSSPDDGSDDDDDKKKKKKKAEADDETQQAPVYDFANQYIDRLVGGKPKP